jgi:hypothetical protein
MLLGTASHRLADMARSIGGKERVGAGKHRAAARAGELHVEFGLGHRIVRQRPDLVGNAIGAGEYAKHAGHRLRRRNIDGDDARVGIRRAYHHRMSLAGQRKVIGEAALAGDEALVLLARQGFADEAIAGFVRSCCLVH